MTERHRPEQNDKTPVKRESAGTAPAIEYLTIGELAERTTLSVSTLNRLRKSGKLVGIQPGGPGTRVVFRADAIEQTAEAACEVTTPVQPDERKGKVRLPGPRARWMGE